MVLPGYYYACININNGTCTGTVPGTSSSKNTPAIYLDTFIEIMKQYQIYSIYIFYLGVSKRILLLL